jgi:hypothetical protein
MSNEPLKIPMEDIDPALRPRCGRRKFPGLCYKRAWKYMMQHDEVPGLKLVHGKITNPGCSYEISHAWVELPEDVIFDGTEGQFYERQSYLSALQARRLIVLSSEEACRRKDSDYGPWFEERNRPAPRSKSVGRQRR